MWVGGMDMRGDADTEREVMASLEEIFHLYGTGDIDGACRALSPTMT